MKKLSNIPLVLFILFLTGCASDSSKLEDSAKNDNSLPIEDCSQENQNDKDWCLYSKALGNGNVETCETIENQQTKDSCFADLAMAIKNDDSLCDKIQNTILKGDCLLEIAIQKRDFSKCDKMPDQRTKNMCYSEQAINEKDASVCEKIEEDFSDLSEEERNNLDPNMSIKLDCEKGVELAQYFSEKNCQTIEDEEEKDNCYDGTARGDSKIEVCEKIVNEIKKEECKTYLEK